MEKIILVIVEWKQDRDKWPAQEVLTEMHELVDTCAGEVVGHLVCRLEKATAGELIGKGKLEELKLMVAQFGADTVIFSTGLKGGQQRNIEEHVEARVIDRTQLILDIFARHAVTREGKTQVELAQLQYLLPRLTGKGVEMSRLGGGIGTLGPGETKLEMDRRRIDQRIVKLKRDLAEITQSRGMTRKRRQDMDVPAVCLVGYTNAGKSTLLNALTQAGQKTHDGLFTTLSSLSRQLILPNNQEIVISDTVGFMHELPHDLIESFKATLEEVREADLLLHVLDISRKNYGHLYESVKDVLAELNCAQKPVIVVLNKIDVLENEGELVYIRKNFPDSVAVCAKSGDGLEQLIEGVEKKLADRVAVVWVCVPMNRMDLVDWAHRQTKICSKEFTAEGCRMQLQMSKSAVGRFREFLIPSDKE